MHIVNDYLKRQQKFIKEWNRNSEKAFENTSFSKLARITNKLIPFIEYLPEPYVGSLKDPVAVFLNYNPGPVLPNGEQKRIGGLFIDKYNAIESYDNFALNTDYFKPNSKSFWHRRKIFASRLLNRDYQDFNILGLEICPWHSQRFSLTKSELSKIKQHLEDDIFKVAEAVAEKAPISTIISVGKNYYELFELLGFKKLKEVNASHQYENWPKKSNGLPINRSLSIWKSNSGGNYFNTYAPGGNTLPKEDFDGIIKELLNN